MSTDDPGPSAAPRPRLGRTVVGLGLVSFFTDAASEMALPLLPFFLTTVIASPATALGVIEGAADTVAGLLKLYAGRLSDRLPRRKPLVVAGYGLSSAARPLLALAGVAGHVLVVRVVDRIGKGLRSSPRDALLSVTAAPEHRGLAFGFHRGMDHAGAVLGPLVALALLAFLTLEEASDEVRVVFAATAVPGALAVLTLLVVVKEPPRQPAAAREDRPRPRLAGLTKMQLRVLLPLFVFAVGNASDVVLLLKVAGEEAALSTAPLLWVGLHVVKTATSPLGGWLADRFGPRKLVVAGWTWYALVYVGLAFAEDEVVLGALFIAYGLFHGLTEGPERALVASLSTEEERGTAFGWYHLTVAAAALPAGLLFGGLWDAFGAAAALFVAAGLAGAASVLLLALAKFGAQDGVVKPPP